MERDVPIRDVMTRDYVGVTEGDTVRGAVELMREEQSGCVLVLRGSDPVGIVTEWDVLGVIESGRPPDGTDVGDVMSSPLISADADVSLADAAGRMAGEGIRHLLVTEGGDPAGVLTQRDVIAAAGSIRAATADGGGETAPPVEEAPATAESRGETAEANGSPSPTDRNFQRQGICEVCGAFAETLWEANGEVVCEDCRGV